MHMNTGPSTEIVTNAVLTRHVLDDANGTVRGAVYGRDGMLVSASQRSVDRSDNWAVADPATIDRESAIVGYYGVDGADVYLEKAVLGGHLFSSWGHVITESVSTAWAAAEIDPRLPVVFVPWGRLWVSSLERSFRALRLAGWDSRQIIVASGKMLFGELAVPQRLFQVGEVMDSRAAVDARMNSIYYRVASRARTSAKRPRRRGPVFFSRFPEHRRRHPEEGVVTELLRRAGVRTVDGWRMSVEEQVVAAAGASAVLGFSGSSLHNSVFAQVGTPVIEIGDSRVPDDRVRGIHRLQGPLCDLRRQPYVVIDGYLDMKARSASDIMDDILGLLDAHDNVELNLD